MLRKLDAILTENADNFHSAVANFNTFSDVLARNSDRIEGLLGGLERLTGGGASKTEVPVYDVSAVKDFPALAATPPWQLVIPEPSALLALNTDKIRVRPADAAETTDIADAKWTDNVPILLQEKIIQSFENAGYSRAVSRPREGFEAGFQLLLDIRSFSLVTGAEPMGEFSFEAKVLGPGGKIIAAKTFHSTAPATGTNAPAAAAALNRPSAGPQASLCRGPPTRSTAHPLSRPRHPRGKLNRRPNRRRHRLPPRVFSHAPSRRICDSSMTLSHKIELLQT